jgi:phosphoglycolate phosphatase-like HAD superfamily hydrolase
MAIIKLLSDFDGIWTDQDAEAVYVRQYIVKKLSQLSRFPEKEIEEILQECKNDMDKSPQYYGWINNGHFACYYQEDPFGDNNAVFEYIDKSASKASYSNYKQKLAQIKEAILKKTKNTTLAEFSNECFKKSTTQFKMEGKLRPAPNAGAVVKELNKKGVEIVVASNSKTEKIEHLFRKAGHTVTNEKAIIRGRLHAIGDAGKFEIDSEFDEIPSKLNVTKKYQPELRRKSYMKILVAEKPDYVIGDVFSLDIALPVYLRLKDKRFSRLKVIQKIQKHTPDWVKDYLKSDELKGIAFMIESIEELSDLIARPA